MRELKFRVWSEEQKTYNYKFPYNELGQFYVSEHGKVFSDFGNTVAPEIRQEAFVIEQYTGLKDKNGKEIYEGDIVKDNTDGIDLVNAVFWCENGGFWGLKPNSPLVDRGWGWFIDRNVEVIGNIHENPELIGGKK